MQKHKQSCDLHNATLWKIKPLESISRSMSRFNSNQWRTRSDMRRSFKKGFFDKLDETAVSKKSILIAARDYFSNFLSFKVDKSF